MLNAIDCLKFSEHPYKPRSLVKKPVVNYPKKTLKDWLSAGLYYLLLVLISFSLGCSSKEPGRSTKLSHSISKDSIPVIVKKSSHMDDCTAPHIRITVLNTFHYYVSEDDQEKLCNALYESAYYLDEESLAAEDVIKNPIEELPAEYQYASKKIALTAGFVTAATLVTVLISYELYRRHQKKYIEGDVNVKDLLTRFEEAKKNYRTTNDAVAYRQTLEALWKEVYPISKSQSWLLKAEILDEVDDLVAAHGDKIKPMAQSVVDNIKLKPVKGHFVPLVDLKDVGYFADAMTFYDGLTDEQLAALKIKRSDLSSIKNKQLIELLEVKTTKTFIKEQSKVGKVIKNVYQQKGINGFLSKPIRSKFITAMLTNVSGWMQRLTASPDKIAKTSKSLGITPYEVVSDASGQAVFRGVKYLFGKKISDYKTFNDFFIRDLTDVARADYLRQAQIENEHILENFDKAKAADLSAVVIASADSRVRLAKLAPGDLNRPQKIVGKVLNESAAEYAEQKGDNPVYYGDEYAFRVSDSLLVNVKSDGEPDYPVMDDPALSLDDKFQRAQQALLGLVYDDMNKNGVYQVTQRLAPADIHNYTAPVNGRALNFKEATEFLELKANERSISDEKRKTIESMKRIFAEQDSDKPLIEIKGKQYSVATEAVSQKANILSQNNRKIMIMKHAGIDTYSIHVFIGATGVDQVHVNQDNVDYFQGDRAGDMAFGMESKDGKLVSGQSIGKFPVNGSTVQSFYFSRDVEETATMNKHRLAFGNKDDTPEVRAKMGDVLFTLRQERLRETEARFIAEDIFNEKGHDFTWTENNVRMAIGDMRKIIDSEWSAKTHTMVDRIIKQGKKMRQK